MQAERSAAMGPPMGSSCNPGETEDAGTAKGGVDSLPELDLRLLLEGDGLKSSLLRCKSECVWRVCWAVYRVTVRVT